MGDEEKTMSELVQSYKENVKKVMIFVLGPQKFSDLYNFFLDIFSKFNPNVIVLTTRRAHLLFSLFKYYIFTENDIERMGINKVLFIDDKAIDSHRKAISKAKTVVVVDDILIHGRALEDVIYRLKKAEPQTVKKAVFIVSKETDYEVDHFSYKLEKKLWKQFSNKIVVALILSSMPYASYLYSFFMPLSISDFELFKENCFSLFKTSSLKEDDYKLDLYLKEVDNETRLNKALTENIEAYIFPLNQKPDNNEFLRVYYNKFTQLLYVIPTVFLDDYNENQIQTLYEKIFKSKKLKHKTQDCGYETKYRLLSAYFSYRLIYKHNLKTNLKLDLFNKDFFLNKNAQEIIDMSFYCGCYTDFSNADFSVENTNNCEMLEPSTLLKEYKTKLKHKDEHLCNDIYFREFKKLVYENYYLEDDYLLFGKHSSFTAFMYEYLKNVDIEEEKTLSNQIENSGAKQFDLLNFKQRGLSFAFVKLLSSEKRIPLFKIYSSIISGADTGLITFYADSYSCLNTNMYSNYLITGEQVCRLYQSKNLISILILKNFYEYVKSQYTLDLAFTDFIKECVSKYSFGINQGHLINLASYIENLDEFTSEFLITSIYERINDKYLEDFIYNAYKHLK